MHKQVVDPLKCQTGLWTCFKSVSLQETNGFQPNRFKARESYEIKENVSLGAFKKMTSNVSLTWGVQCQVETDAFGNDNKSVTYFVVISIA